MQKPIRRIAIGLSIGGLAAMSLIAVWLCRPERTLIEMARMVAPIDTERQEWAWISESDLLMMTTEQEPDNLNGPEEEEIHWRGRAELWNVVKGQHTRLSGLTDLLNRKDVSPYGQPALCRVSPGGTWLIWYNQRTAPHGTVSRGTPTAARLDGSHYRDWGENTDNGSFLDDQHWIEETAEGTRPMTHIVDLGDKSKNREFPSDSPQADAVLADYARQHPYSVSAELSPQSDSVDISTYRTAEATSLTSLLEDASRSGARPLRKSEVKLPQGATLLSCEPSPNLQRILYYLQTEYKNPLRAFLHRLLPTISEKPLQTESLWVSKSDGTGFHKIGHVIVHQDKVGSDGEKELSQIEWLPGGKQVSFLYHHILYVVPEQ